MATTKSDLIQRIAEKTALEPKRAEQMVNLIFDSMADALKRGDRIELRGFGVFENRRYDAYQGRNPKTGETCQVSPKVVPFFKAGKLMKEMLNSAGGPSRD